MLCTAYETEDMNHGRACKNRPLRPVRQQQRGYEKVTVRQR